jgi:predicted O-methyltransferase YrrM
MPSLAGGTSLEDPRVKSTLARLHRAAGWGEIPRIISCLPDAARAFSREGAAASATALFRTSYTAVSAAQGRFLYVAARAINARRIVEFGTSYGISTIYLAAAARDADGVVIGSEFERQKYDGARTHLAEAGLTDYAEIRLGDARATLADISAPIDFALLDGPKELNLPVLNLLIPKLRKGSIVVADDIFRFRAAMASYVELMQSGRNGFCSASLPIGGGFEYSVYQG